MVAEKKLSGGEPGHLHAHGEGPDEPALERLLRDDPEVLVAEAVEQLISMSTTIKSMSTAPKARPFYTYC